MKSRYIVIRDEHSKLFGHRFLNSQLSLYLGLIQLMVCSIWALAQHVWSIFTFEKILHCDFSGNSTLPPLLTHVDAIIFDVGLFHHLWGITGCVAQHLDGGYGRFLWCIVHTTALLTCLPLAFVRRPKPQWLWPLLVQQSAYGVGILAALPKAAHMLGDIQNAPVQAIFFYTLGTLMNFFLLYVYWHWYWHVESLWNSARKLRRGETLTKSERRPFRRVASSPAGGMGNFCQLQDNNDDGARPVTNGHIPAGEKKQLSVTLIDGNHHLTKVMPITRIEPSNSEDRNLAAKAQEAEKHHRVNSTKSLPNGHAHLKHRHQSKMPNGELKQHHRKRKGRKEGGNGSADANSIVSNTSGSTATTTTTMAHAGKLDGLRPPPSPAPPAMSTTDGLPAPAFQYSPEEALPPRVRHLRREEGRPKSPRKSSNSTMGSSRKSSEGSTSSQQSNESRKPSLEQNVTQQMCYQKIVENPTISTLPPNGQLPPKHRQLSLRQRRRLSLRQRNQLAARKQHQQQQWAEKVGVAPLISRQSMPVMPVPVPVPLDGGNPCNGIYNFPPKYAQQMPPPQQFTTKILPSKQNFHGHRPNLQMASSGWSSIDHFVLSPNGHGNFVPYPPVCNGNGGMARTPVVVNNRSPLLQHDFPKRPLDGPLNSLPLNFANGQRNCTTTMLIGWNSDQLGTKFPHNDPPSPAKGLRV